MFEKCIICGTKNYLFPHDLNALAWECYFCQARHWLDYASKEEYMLEKECSEWEADQDLQISFEDIIFIYGEYDGSNL